MKRILLTLALCLALAACHDDTAPGSGSTTTPTRKSTMNDKLNIQHNPHPKMRYEITLTIQDAPGPFESVTGFMQYEVENERCSPENPIEGTYGKRPYKDIPIEFTRTGDNTYTGTVYLDLLQDADYFGLGVCRWKMVAVIVRLKAGEVTFSPDISSSKIVAQQLTKGYFAKETYGQTAIKDLHDGSVPLSDWISKQPEKFFSATLIAKESFQ